MMYLSVRRQQCCEYRNVLCHRFRLPTNNGCKSYCKNLLNFTRYASSGHQKRTDFRVSDQFLKFE